MNDVVLTGLSNWSGICLAYIGPGSGVSIFWSLLAVLGGILFMIVGLLLWPVRVLLRSIKKNKAKNKGEGSPNPNVEDAKVIGDDK